MLQTKKTKRMNLVFNLDQDAWSLLFSIKIIINVHISLYTSNLSEKERDIKFKYTNELTLLRVGLDLLETLKRINGNFIEILKQRMK